MRSFLKFAAIFLLTAVLSSCLDTREEIWIAPDSSGAARINISIPATAAALHGGEEGVKKLIEDYIAATPAITSHLLATETGEGRLFVDLTLTFADALDFLAATSAETRGNLPPSGAELMGKSEVGFHGLSVDFSRTVDLSEALPLALFVPQDQLEGHSLTTIIHLPKAASSHNATSTAGGGRTLIWETTLTQAFKEPVVNAFTMPIPIPWSLISLVTLLALILVSTLFVYLRRRKQASAPSP
jgi:hypothetical protein